MQRILIALVAVLTTGTLAADEISCGTVGPTRTVAAGTYGPAFGGTRIEACEAVVSGAMLTDTCAGCVAPEEGCDWAANWKGGAPDCDVDLIPGTNPPVYLANYFLGADKRGYVSCSQCDQ